MGIPKYFKWITTKYTDLIIDNKSPLSALENDDNINLINNLFLDANCLIHPCVRKVLLENADLIKIHKLDYSKNRNNIQTRVDIYSKLEKCMFKSVVDYIIYLTNFVNPSDLLYIAIDGVAPRAKMEQQRTRRYRSQLEKELKNAIYKKYTDSEPPESWDTNQITPGSLFMLKLSNYLQSNLPDLLKNNNINLILSDTSRPGEGEHKIMEYLRKDNDSNINCIYGLDADLIMLALCSNKKIYLLREAVHFGIVESDHLLYFSIPGFKNVLYDEIQVYIDQTEFELSDNIIIDYVFLCFLLGNDFLPHLVNLDISNDSISDLILIYAKLLSIRKQYLIDDDCKINYSFLQQILNQIFNDEDVKLRKIQKKIDRRYIPKKKYSSIIDEEIGKINYYPLIRKNNYIKLGSKNWREEYYNHYFNIKNIIKSKTYIDNICKIYIQGLQWTIQYYIKGCVSWRWYYPFRAAPCLRELSQFLNNRQYQHNFGKTKPYNQLQQLSLVLPRSSSQLLPDNFHKTICSNIPGITEYYPISYKLDTLNNIWFHECNPIIPILNDKKVLKILDSLKLDKIAKLRNKITDEDIYIKHKINSRNVYISINQ